MGLLDRFKLFSVYRAVKSNFDNIYFKYHQEEKPEPRSIVREHRAVVDSTLRRLQYAELN